MLLYLFYCPQPSLSFFEQECWHENNASSHKTGLGIKYWCIFLYYFNKHWVLIHYWFSGWSMGHCITRVSKAHHGVTLLYLWKIIPIMKSTNNYLKEKSIVVLESICPAVVLELWLNRIGHYMAYSCVCFVFSVSSKRLFYPWFLLLSLSQQGNSITID